MDFENSAISSYMLHESHTNNYFDLDIPIGLLREKHFFPMDIIVLDGLLRIC
jgi:hypothetical protein